MARGDTVGNLYAHPTEKLAYCQNSERIEVNSGTRTFAEGMTCVQKY
jgi:hypothetical protein